MVKEEFNTLNSMLELERKNAELRLEIKRKNRQIKRLQEKIKKLERR